MNWSIKRTLHHDSTIEKRKEGNKKEKPVGATSEGHEHCDLLIIGKFTE